jgi:hypothetical protein
VQQRIRGKFGHLSNPDMSALLASLAHERLRLVVLSHISAENNDPELVFELARRVMHQHGTELVVAQQHHPTRMFEVLP